MMLDASAVALEGRRRNIADGGGTFFSLALFVGSFFGALEVATVQRRRRLFPASNRATNIGRAINVIGRMDR